MLLTVSIPTPRTARGVGHPLFGFINKKQDRKVVLFRDCSIPGIVGHPAGGSISGGFTLPFGLGVQGVANGSVGALGPVVGAPGFLAASTFAACARIF